MYTNMPKALQIINAFKRRWCSAYWQAAGITVIPAVGWSDEDSFDFCFDGIEKESIVAVSTLGCKKNKDTFLKGYREMINRINPPNVICYCKPFDEMKETAEIIAVPYERLSVQSKSHKGNS